MRVTVGMCLMNIIMFDSDCYQSEHITNLKLNVPIARYIIWSLANGLPAA